MSLVQPSRVQKCACLENTTMRLSREYNVSLRHGMGGVITGLEFASRVAFVCFRSGTVLIPNTATSCDITVEIHTILIRFMFGVQYRDPAIIFFVIQFFQNRNFLGKIVVYQDSSTTSLGYGYYYSYDIQINVEKHL